MCYDYCSNGVLINGYEDSFDLEYAAHEAKLEAEEVMHDNCMAEVFLRYGTELSQENFDIYFKLVWRQLYEFDFLGEV